MLATALVVASCGSAAHPGAQKVPSLPGSVVMADGHKVYFDCEGTGSPTVIFVSGWGADSASWSDLFRGTSRITRACVYDRWRVGFTATYEKPGEGRARDGHDQVRELEQLLHNAEIDPPYVLVGHSWGGSLPGLYAGTHDGGKAAVLVDSAVPGQERALMAAVPPPRPGENSSLDSYRHAPPDDPLQNPEQLAFQKSLKEVDEVKSLGDRPLAVIT